MTQDLDPPPISTADLEAEIARLQAALDAATTGAQRASEDQDERHRADLAASGLETADANRRTADATAGALDAEREHERQMAGAAIDLTASQELVAQLRAGQLSLATIEARQKAIFDSAIDVAMVITNPVGIITDWNPGAQHVMGWTAAEIIGEDAARFFTPEDRAAGRVDDEMRQALRDGRASDERWHLREGGERFWASGEMLPLYDPNAGHLGFVKTLRDRTQEHVAGSARRTRP